MIHEYGHALSNFDFYKTGIYINSVIEEGMVELFKDLVIEPNIYTKNNPLLIFIRMQDKVSNIMDVYFSEKEASGKGECHRNSIGEYIISKVILRNLKNSLEKCKKGEEVIEVYQEEEKIAKNVYK